MNEVKNADWISIAIESINREYRYSIESIYSRLNQAEESIWEVEDRSFNIIQSQENKEKKWKRVKQIYMIYGIPLPETIFIIKVPEGEEQEQGAESLFKGIMAENLTIITLYVSGLNSPIKRHRVAEWIKNKNQLYAAYKRFQF